MPQNNPLTKYGLHARQAVDYVEKTMTIGASNKFSDRLFSLMFKTESSLTCVLHIRGQYTANSNRIGRLREMAKKASNAGCGNCGEQAAIAFIWLHDKKIGSLDYMTRVNADHAFVVIGRDRNSPANEPEKWGSDAYVCDPWHEKSYAASEIKYKMYGGGIIAPNSFVFAP